MDHQEVTRMEFSKKHGHVQKFLHFSHNNLWCKKGRVFKSLFYIIGNEGLEIRVISLTSCSYLTTKLGLDSRSPEQDPFFYPNYISSISRFQFNNFLMHMHILYSFVHSTKIYWKLIACHALTICTFRELTVWGERQIVSKRANGASWHYWSG